MSKTVIIGGVAGGASAAARLRRLDENAEIVLFERGDFISFANCGLPYYVGKVITERANLQVTDPQRMKERFRIDVRIKQEVTGINRAEKTVHIKNLMSGEEYDEGYDTCIIATGTEPALFGVADLPKETLFLVRDIPETIRLEERLAEETVSSAVVVGGGFLGIEMAENLRERKVRTYLVEKENQVMAPADPEMAICLEDAMRQRGIKTILSCGIDKATPMENGKVSVRLENGNELEADIVVMCAGVRPASRLAREAGLEINQYGAIEVNDYMQTSDKSIYAVGDVAATKDAVTGEIIPRYLAGPANRQGRIAANNIAGRAEAYRGTLGSSVVKVFDSVLASTGYNEKQLKKRGTPYQKVYIHAADHATYYPDAYPIYMKLLFTPDDGKILGAQAFGKNGVDKRIDVIATALYAGLTVYDLEKIDLCYAPPFSSAKDPVNVAGYCAVNSLKGDVALFYYEEVEDLVQAGACIVDVSTPEEYAAGHIKSAQNIPVDTLRGRLDELPKDRPVYVYCKIGLRGYIASRILRQNGCDARSLSGGWDGYKAYILK